jgi:predicted CXXCH cytochrome family protein
MARRSAPARPARPSRRPAYLLGLALTLAALVVAAIAVRQRAAAPATAVAERILQATYVGTTTCAACHAGEHTAWRGSQHEQAMADATPDRVLGNFDNVTVRHGGTETRFFRRGNEYWVNADGGDGARADFRIRYTFGVDPLQQYLIEMPDGRIQALSVAWDSRPAPAGGQRWFHLYGDEPIPAGDELHWTGRQQNWNYMCADCHSTNLRKNYDPAANRFATTWSEINVACEACHGPGSDHVRWAGASSLSRQLFWRGTNGLTVALDERDDIRWTVDGETMKPVRSAPRTTATEITTCAPCHSRRAQIADGYRPGLPLLDFYTPASITPGLFHADGQQLDEVYTYTSFLQSRMNHAGVTCSDCHDPHTARLRATGNTLCAQCHVPARYDTPDHHRHPQGSPGAACVSCHMPERTYMRVDPRRDHGFRVPRPDLSVSIGVPNACTDCHASESNAWAAGHVRDWFGRDASGFQTFAPVLHADDTNEPGVEGRLAVLATDATQPATVRASALERLARRPGTTTMTTASAAIADEDPAVRLAAVRASEGLPPRERLALAGPALVDPIRAVRLEAARLLAPAAGAIANAAGQDVLERTLGELQASLRFNADRPESRNAEAAILADRGRMDEAVAVYRAALDLAPDYAATYINLADLQSRRGREGESEATLRDGIARNGPRPELLHALGLSLVRAGRRDDAVRELERAATLAPEVARFGYAWAVALHSTGDSDRAIAVLQATLSRHPTDRDSLIALATFHRDAGRRNDARAAAERLARAYPDDAGAQALLASLR